MYLLINECQPYLGERYCRMRNHPKGHQLYRGVSTVFRPSIMHPRIIRTRSYFLHVGPVCVAVHSDRSVLVMKHFGRFSSSSSTQNSRSPFFVYLDGAGAVPSSFFCGTCSICNAQFFYSYYTDHNGTARFYDSTSSRPFSLLCQKSASSACALDMKLLERYRLLLTHGHLTMTAYMEIHNSLFDGD